MSPDLSTTNILLGIMAAVSVLQALVVVGVGIAAVIAYRKVAALAEHCMDLAAQVESRQIAPAMRRVDAILDDVKGMTATMRSEVERVDHAVHSAIDRIDHSATRVRTNIWVKTSTLLRFIRGTRNAIEAMLRPAKRA